jgi:hypothetical protein
VKPIRLEAAFPLRARRALALIQGVRRISGEIRRHSLCASLRHEATRRFEAEREARRLS